MNIDPIKLLSGSHSDTGETGQGCFMNVIAYLNGEAKITDRSPCVCVTIRPIAIFANDFMNDAERKRLLSYVMRAMGTATDDRKTILFRLKHVVDFAQKMARYAVADAARYAERYAERYAAAAAAAAADVADAARYAARYAVDARKNICDACVDFLEAVCPPITPFGDEVLSRAKKLGEMSV